MKSAFKICVPFLVLPMAGCLSFGSQGVALTPTDTAGITALNGGLIGQEKAGKTLSSDARTQALEAEFKALQFAPAGSPVSWAAGGYKGEVVPTQLYRVGSQDCRGYTHTFARDSAPAVRAVGTACKTAGGLWAPVA